MSAPRIDPERLATAEWLTRSSTQSVMTALTVEGHRVCVVGGAVRNGLLGEKVADIDMATDARPETVMTLARRAGLKAVPTGIEHGTVTVVADHTPFEVTTLRRDVETFGRHARVDFTDDWGADAARRDFTINALFCEADGTVLDYVGGLEDLAARRIRFIGSAIERIREDYLRILRFFRFTATYGRDGLDVEGLRACVAERAGLRRLSGERIRAELMKLIVAKGALPVLDVMLGHGLIADVVGVPWLTRLVRVVAQEEALGAPPDPVLRLAALTVCVAEDGTRLFERLKLSGAERDRLLALGATIAMDFPTDPRSAEELLYRFGMVTYHDRLMLAWARAGVSADDAAWQTLAKNAGASHPRVFPLRGRDLIGLGASPGPRLGEILRQIEDAWVAGGFLEDRAALLERAKSLVNSAG
ncbi:MAG: CCA tRNA nucleotidyltransferase [Hyphomicrobiaceae bacterium]